MFSWEVSFWRQSFDMYYGVRKHFSKSNLHLILFLTYEPPHDKTNEMTVRPAKTQISLGIRPVWSESSLRVKWVAKDPSLLHVDSEDSDQPGRMIWIFAPGAHVCHFVGFCHEAAHIKFLRACYSNLPWFCSQTTSFLFMKTKGSISWEFWLRISAKILAKSSKCTCNVYLRRQDLKIDPFRSTLHQLSHVAFCSCRPKLL